MGNYIRLVQEEICDGESFIPNQTQQEGSIQELGESIVQQVTEVAYVERVPYGMSSREWNDLTVAGSHHRVQRMADYLGATPDAMDEALRRCGIFGEEAQELRVQYSPKPVHGANA